MHRGVVQRLLVGACAAVMGVTGCASGPDTRPPDPPAVEGLRVRITKTRHAVRETREAIARSKGSPALPELYVRLAELLSEEARYHNQVAYEREEKKSRLIHAPHVRLLKEQAIGIYKQVLGRFPDVPLVARVRFNIGHELRELGQFDEMVTELTTLVTDHPDSPLADEALLVLGDYWFDKADLDNSAAHYAQIARRPLSRVSGLGEYKLAWVWVNRGGCVEALEHFEQALTKSAAWDAQRQAEATAPRSGPRGLASVVGVDVEDVVGPATAQAIDVQRESLVDLVYCYTQERDPETLMAFLRERAVDRYAYVAAVRRAVARFGVMNQRGPGLAASRELLTLAPADADRVDDARALYGFLDNAKGVLLRGEDVAQLAGTVRARVQRPELTDEARFALIDEFEQMARDVLTEGQQKAQKVTDVAAREAALAEVAAGYVHYLDAFPASTKQGAVRLGMLKNLADAEGVLGDELSAGMRWLTIAGLEPEPQASTKALFEATSHLQRALSVSGSRAQVGRVVARASLRRAGLNLLRAGALEKGKGAAVKFAIALTYFDEGRFREAIDRFTALAYEVPGTETADNAVFLALDAYDAVGDHDGLIVAGRRFLATGTPVSSGAMAKISPAVARAEAEKLDELALTASGADGGELGVLERFADRYKGSSLGERALLNAFVAARAQGDSAALARLGEQLVAEYPDSDEASGVISSLAKSAVANLDYERAITAFRKAATVEAADSVTLLTTAAELMVQLGDSAGAVDVLKQALARAKTPAARGAVGARLAVRLEQLGDPRKTVAALTPLVGDRQPEVLATLGLAQIAAGQTEAGESTLQRVLDASAQAPEEAQARAHLGSAEVLTALMKGLNLDGSLEAIEELTTLTEVAEQAYLNAARQGSPLVTAAALSRLSAMATAAAARLRTAPPPAGLGTDEQAAIKAALGQRADQLVQLGASALSTCADQAWTTKVFNPTVRRCLKGEALRSPTLPHDLIKRRAAGAGQAARAQAKAALAKAKDDPEALMAVGAALLDAGDPHVARLILARALANGAGHQAANLAGIAHFRAGDLQGGLEAFARAADAGLEAGRQNLKAALERLGLGAAAAKVLQKWPEAGEEGGRRLAGGGP